MQSSRSFFFLLRRKATSAKIFPFHSVVPSVMPPPMSKTLIIAEKPSVATDLSRALAKAPEVGKFEKKGKGRDVYFENQGFIITSAVGHLVELKMPQGPIGKNGKPRNLPWNFDVL